MFFPVISLLLSLQGGLPPASQCLVVMNPNVLKVFSADFYLGPALDGRKEKVEKLHLKLNTW